MLPYRGIICVLEILVYWFVLALYLGEQIKNGLAQKPVRLFALRVRNAENLTLVKGGEEK
jgi:hypothetical protein